MITKTKLPKFHGKQIIPKDIKFPEANFLKGDFGEAVFYEVMERTKNYKNVSALNVLKYEDGVVKGSNPFVVVLINQIIRPEGLRTATQVDLEKILKTEALNLGGFYEDSALVLRSEEEPNKYLAQDLAKQLKARYSKIKHLYPAMISLNSLELRNDQNSDYGLAFKLKDEAEIFYAPHLSNKNDYKKFSETGKEGLPLFNKNGNRILYTIDAGLSRLYLGRGLDLDSDTDDLASSDSDGRVVVVNSEGASQNFKG